jgi:hypothetical protein
MNCKDNYGCSVAYNTQSSISIGFSSEISPGSGPLKGWTKAGFSVQKSWSTGNNYNCKGHQGEQLCVWYNTAHTACE